MKFPSRLDGGQHHRRVGVRQPRGHTLADALRIVGAGGFIGGQGVLGDFSLG